MGNKAFFQNTSLFVEYSNFIIYITERTKYGPSLSYPLLTTVKRQQRGCCNLQPRSRLIYFKRNCRFRYSLFGFVLAIIECIESGILKENLSALGKGYNLVALEKIGTLCFPDLPVSSMLNDVWENGWTLNKSIHVFVGSFFQCVLNYSTQISARMFGLFFSAIFICDEILSVVK